MRNNCLHQTCGAAKRRDYADPNKYDVRYRIETDWHVSEHDDPGDHGIAIMTFKTREGALRYLKSLPDPRDDVHPEFRIVKVVARSRKIGRGVVEAIHYEGRCFYRTSTSDSSDKNTALASLAQNNSFLNESLTYAEACDALRAQTKKGKSK